MFARGVVQARFGECPRQDSNLRLRLRRPPLYPLSYEGHSATFTEDDDEATGRGRSR